MRLLETWPRVPSACAKWLTRSSSSSQGTSRSGAGDGARAAARPAAAGGVLELVDRAACGRGRRPRRRAAAPAAQAAPRR